MVDQSVVYTSPSGYNYSYVLSVEQPFLSDDYRRVKNAWMKENWHYVFLISFVYLMSIVVSKYFMRDRKAFELKAVLIVWNAGLAVYSILGATRSLPEFMYILTQKGFKYSICTETYGYGVTGYWSWLFILSKVVELLDTLFLTLRKREVIFLHWYHHLTVLLYVWYTMVDFPSTCRWFATINYTIHAVMYTYYTIAALRIVRIPKIISMAVTSSQIIQMVIGCYVTIQAYLVLNRGEKCGLSYQNVYLTLAMYGSYFYLFFKFFYDKYLAKASSSKREVTKKE